MNTGTVVIAHNVVKDGVFPIDFIVDSIIKDIHSLKMVAKATKQQFVFHYELVFLTLNDVDAIVSEITDLLDYHYTSRSILTL